MSAITLKNDLEYWRERTTLVLDKGSAKAILNIDEDLETVGFAPNTRQDYIKEIVQLLQFAQKPLNEVTKKDVKKYLRSKKKLKDSTKWTIYQRIRGFFRRYNPELDMEIEFPKKNTKEPNDHHEWIDKLPTQEEIEKLLQYASSTRDKAFIAILVESGARINEVLRMTYKDVQINENYLKITLKGRKKQRDVPIVWGAKYVMRWLDDHFTKKFDDPLWLYTYKGRKGHLNYHGGHEIIKKTAKRAGIMKKLTPHIFRHLKSTLLAKDPTLSTQVKKRLLGHSKSSTTFERVYEHLSDQDVIESVLVGYGLKQKDEMIETRPQLKALNCPRCNAPVMESDKYCSKCWFILDQDAAIAEASIIERQQEEIAALKLHIATELEVVKEEHKLMISGGLIEKTMTDTLSAIFGEIAVAGAKAGIPEDDPWSLIVKDFQQKIREFQQKNIKEMEEVIETLKKPELRRMKKQYERRKKEIEEAIRE